jgi:histidyl-tRNA synthetase
MAEKHQAPRGTRDLLPGDIERWQWVEARAREVLERYGYREIRTPIFEDYELFARSSGEASDVVSKEMYRFKDLGDRDLALRPEGTAGVCRAYLQHGMAQQGRIHRLWYMGPMFRYGRPQKGRYRQFRQVGAEIIGTAAPGADVEMIALFVDLFEAWGFKDLTVALNSLGTPATRRAYGERLRQWLAPVRERLGADSQQRLETNPLRVLDTKNPEELALFQDPTLGAMPRLIDVLDDESREHFEAVRSGLTALGIAHETDHGLVRGLDYYTRTAFEVHDRSLGAQSALGGGGRYDGLIEALGGPSTPGVGFSIGLDRVLLVLEQRGFAPAVKPAIVYLAAMDGTRALAPMLARALRQVYTVDYDLESRGLNAQLKAADKAGARAVVLLGEEEWQRGEIVIKELSTGAQQTVALDGLVEALDRILGPAGESDAVEIR